MLAVKKRTATLKSLDSKTTHMVKIAHYDEVLQYARKVMCAKFALKNGVLNVAVEPNVFKALTGEDWHEPITEPEYEIDVLESAAANKELRDVYNDDMAKYAALLTGVEAVGEFLIEPFKDNKPIMEKLVPTGDMRTVDAIPLKETLARYLTVICEPKPGEIAAAYKRLEALKYDGGDIEEHAFQIRESVKYLNRFEYKYDEQTLVAAIVRGLGGAKGKFKEAFDVFYRRKPKETQTIPHLLDDVRSEVELIQATSAAETGFAAAAEEAAVPVAAAAAGSQQTLLAPELVAQVVTALGFTSLAAAAAAAAKLQQAPPPHRPRGKGDGGKGKGPAAGGAVVDLNAPIPGKRYCWSCGLNDEHDGATCPDPEQGHKPHATQANPLGGRRRHCSVANRVKWPHPT